MATTFLSLLPVPTAWPETAILTGHLAPVWLKYCSASCSLSMINLLYAPLLPPVV